MLKKIHLIWTIVLSTHLCNAQSYGSEPGMLYFKNGDSLSCFVEQAVSYGNIIRYKKPGSNDEFKVSVSDLTAISTPYNFLETVRLDKKELLMSLLVDGETKLYNHISYFSSAPKEHYGGLATNPNPPKILIVLKNDSTTMEVTKKNFEKDVSLMLRKEPSVVKLVIERKLVFEDLETIVSEYDRLRQRRGMARTVTGRILDPETKKGISGAAISIIGCEDRTRTNALGYFKLDILATDTLRVTHSKYQEVTLPSPSTQSFQFALPKRSKEEMDSIKRLESKLTPDDFIALVKNNLYYPYADRKNAREGLVLASVKIDTTGNVETIRLVESVGGCGFALKNVLYEVPPSFWRSLLLRYSTTEFQLPVIFSLNERKDRVINVSSPGKVLSPIYFTYKYEELEYREGTWEKTKVFRMYNYQFETKE
ncbi:MAG TPA: hypothetical protein VGD65_03870 [Chryseosolibacter sp.]